MILWARLSDVCVWLYRADGRVTWSHITHRLAHWHRHTCTGQNVGLFEGGSNPQNCIIILLQLTGENIKNGFIRLHYLKLDFGSRPPGTICIKANGRGQIKFFWWLTELYVQFFSSIYCKPTQQFWLLTFVGGNKFFKVKICTDECLPTLALCLSAEVHIQGEWYLSPPLNIDWRQMQLDGALPEPTGAL